MFFKRFYFLRTLRGSSYVISKWRCVCVCNGNGNAAGVKYYLSIILFLIVSMHLLVACLITDPTHETILFHFFPIGISNALALNPFLLSSVIISIKILTEFIRNYFRGLAPAVICALCFTMFVLLNWTQSQWFMLSLTVVDWDNRNGTLLLFSSFQTNTRNISKPKAVLNCKKNTEKIVRQSNRENGNDSNTMTKRTTSIRVRMQQHRLSIRFELKHHGAINFVGSAQKQNREEMLLLLPQTQHILNHSSINSNARRAAWKRRCACACEWQCGKLSNVQAA